MEKITKAQDYLKAKAAAFDKLANTLDEFAALIPDHKKITNRIITGAMELPERDYSTEYVPRTTPYATISNYYGKTFRVHYEDVAIDYHDMRTKWESEQFNIDYRINYVEHEYTPAELKAQMHERADLRRKEASEYRAGIKTLAKRVDAYHKATEAYNASVDALSYVERDALSIKGTRIY